MGRAQGVAEFMEDTRAVAGEKLGRSWRGRWDPAVGGPHASLKPRELHFAGSGERGKACEQASDMIRGMLLRD